MNCYQIRYRGPYDPIDKKANVTAIYQENTKKAIDELRGKVGPVEIVSCTHLKTIESK